MTIGQIECFAGISGDMLLGALIDAGVPAELLQNAAAALGIGAELRIRAANRSEIQATKVDVLEHGVVAENGEHEHGHHEHEHHHGDVEHLHGHEHSHERSYVEEHGHAHGRNWPEIRALISEADLPAPAKKIALRAFELLAEAEAKVHGLSLIHI